MPLFSLDPNFRADGLASIFVPEDDGVPTSQGPQLSQDVVTWVTQVRRLRDGSQFTFENRDYLLPLYRDNADEIYIVKGRQTEITEYAENWLLFNLWRYPGAVGLYMSDNQDRVSVFSKLRLHEWGIEKSPILKDMAADNLGNVSWQPWKNTSHLFMFSAFGDFDKALSIPADFVVIDEAQNQDLTALPKVKESMSHSKHKKIRVIGTGSFEGDSWFNLWMSGDQREWDWKARTWVARRPENDRVAHSYHLSQEIVPWITAEEIEKKRNSPSYTPMRFLQEVIGEWWKGARKPLTEKDIVALFDNSLSFVPAAEVRHELGPVFGGFDWGGGQHTVYWIWQMVDAQAPRFRLLNTGRIETDSPEGQAEEVANLVDAYKLDQGVMDGGGGQYQVEKLAKRYAHRMVLNFYMTAPKKPGMPDPTMPLDFTREENRITVDRTWIIESLIDLIKRPDPQGYHRVAIPHAQPPLIDWVIDQFTCIETEEVNLPGGARYIRYFRPETKRDDALHGAVFALLAKIIYKWNKRGARFFGAEL